jgi:uridine phosphorylase
MGGPSAAIVLAELISLGARRAIRIGTCGALAPERTHGQLVVAREAICADGTSRALGAEGRAPADGALTSGLEASAPGARAGAIVSVDLFYSGDGGTPHEDAIAVEMEAATLFTLGAREAVAVGCALVVSDTFGADGRRQRIEDSALVEAAERMGAAAIAALAAEAAA